MDGDGHYTLAISSLMDKREVLKRNPSAEIVVAPASDRKENNHYSEYRRRLRSCLPIVHWLPKYGWKHDLPGDLAAGCTVAMMHIPEGLGYALVAFLPPAVGIYTAFFPVLVYFLLGTSRYNCFGAVAAVSILLCKSVSELADVEKHLDSNNPARMHNDPIVVAATVCFACGIIQLAMYVCRLGFVCYLLSDALLSGVTAGVGVQVLTLMVKNLLGLPFTPIVGYCWTIRAYIDILNEIERVNLSTILISAVTVTLQLINVYCFKPWVEKFGKFPVPAEIVILVIGTMLSMFLQLPEKYNTRTLGTFKSGVPVPSLPDFSLLPPILPKAFMIAVVSYVLSVGKALPTSKREKHTIHFNQELLAMGAGNLLGCVFSCMPTAACPSRSTAQYTAGGKSQLTSIVSCLLLVPVLFWIGPLLAPLPTCILSSIICVSLGGQLKQLKQFFQFWERNREDGIVWLGSFLAIVLVSIDAGLLVGLGLSFLASFYRFTHSHIYQLQHVPNTNLYMDMKRFKGTVDITGVKIFQFIGSLNFLSILFLERYLTRAWASELRLKLVHICSDGKVYDNDNKCVWRLRYLVVDFSELRDIDMAAGSKLQALLVQLDKINVEVLLVVPDGSPMYELVRNTLPLDEAAEIRNGKIFTTVNDAVLHASSGITRARIHFHLLPGNYF
ncbi:solute carrier family 26 member 6-like [Sabethes cyaneus]|uniref:solute carrier family 26 member 6-like n=1 Tax=Sabethes cyaneus TaxID=53552 RepID=UPI00237EA00F|nr:solute carrier family 26 member 6-like [Sabethes cyaneus]